MWSLGCVLGKEVDDVLLVCVFKESDWVEMEQTKGIYYSHFGIIICWPIFALALSDSPSFPSRIGGSCLLILSNWVSLPIFSAILLSIYLYPAIHFLPLLTFHDPLSGDAHWGAIVRRSRSSRSNVQNWYESLTIHYVVNSLLYLYVLQIFFLALSLTLHLCHFTFLVDVLGMPPAALLESCQAKARGQVFAIFLWHCTSLNSAIFCQIALRWTLPNS